LASFEELGELSGGAAQAEARTRPAQDEVDLAKATGGAVQAEARTRFIDLGQKLSLSRRVLTKIAANWAAGGGADIAPAPATPNDPATPRLAGYSPPKRVIAC
jgi:hypothetical protein